jgi:hypothetical protein
VHRTNQEDVFVSINTVLYTGLVTMRSIAISITPLRAPGYLVGTDLFAPEGWHGHYMAMDHELDIQLWHGICRTDGPSRQQRLTISENPSGQHTA